MKVLFCILAMTMTCSIVTTKLNKQHFRANNPTKVSMKVKTPVKITKKPEVKPTIRKRVVRRKLPSRGAGGYRIVEATAYCSCYKCCGKSNGITAFGMKARYGVIAVDPGTISLGTRVYVDGYGMAVAGDTGGAISGNRIDVCFNSHKEALQWGRRKVKIIIY